MCDVVDAVLPSQVKVTGCRESEISMETFTLLLLSLPSSLCGITGLKTYPGFVERSLCMNFDLNLITENKIEKNTNYDLLH